MIVYRELSSLEADLGFSARALYSLSNSIENHYTHIKLPKKNGDFRVLSVPDDLLKLVQKKIARVILGHYPISEYATAYRSGSSVQKNARKHINKEKVLKLDIKHFFDSIMYSTVKEKVFPAEHFSESNRVLLTMLCYYKDALPQGAPTSPVITNVIMRDFDELIGTQCKSKNIDYTRYCDDMTFSGSFDEKEIIKLVSDELRKMGFFLNKRKISVANRWQKQFVTGIVVNEKANTDISYRKKLRQEVYYCKKFGVSEHLKHIGYCGRNEQYLNGLYAKLSYALHTNPDDKKLSEARDFIADLMK